MLYLTKKDNPHSLFLENLRCVSWAHILMDIKYEDFVMWHN